MTTVLRVEGVSKQYRIYDCPGDRLKESLTRGRWKAHHEFWALKDVSFEVERGTTFGIVGPNGCGKSTLLQIIAGTLEPTHGSVFVEGRVAALLELGAGFNPEFTGIENVFMNGALMGFSRRETEALLPEIKRFAEIGDFIRQPVKTYSSGMYVRLAFATAVSAAPQVLIVDEALAVGDVVFQHRCMRRIKEMQERGVTILLVSHDPAAIRHLCTRAMLLSEGHRVTDGSPIDVLNRYQKLMMEHEEAYDISPSAAGDANRAEEFSAEREETRAPLRPRYRHGDGSAEIISAELLDAARNSVELVETGASVQVRMRVQFHRGVDNPVFGFLVRNRHGVHVYGTNTEQQYRTEFGHVARGEAVEVTFTFDCWLGTDTYTLSFAVHGSAIFEEGISYDWLDDVIFFRVTSATLIEGLVNLNANATARRLKGRTTLRSAGAASTRHG